jgi:hypothetical protein
VQDAESLLPVEDVEIAVQLAPRVSNRRAILAQASHAAATNKLMQAVIVEVPTAGTWDVLVACSAGSERREVACEVDVAEPLPEWFAVWPWFTWPVGVVVLFAAHQILLQRKAVCRSSANVPTAF